MGMPNLSGKSSEDRLEVSILLLGLGVLIVVLRGDQLIGMRRGGRGLCAAAASCTWTS